MTIFYPMFAMSTIWECSRSNNTTMWYLRQFVTYIKDDDPDFNRLRDKIRDENLRL